MDQRQITLKEALKLVTFTQKLDGTWYVAIVKGDCGSVRGDCATVIGNCDTILGDCRTIGGKVFETINNRQWQFIETPIEILRRLIEEGADKEQLLEAVNQLEESDD